MVIEMYNKMLDVSNVSPLAESFSNEVKRVESGGEEA